MLHTAVLAAALAVSAQAAPAGTITVSAAVSLTEVMQAIARAYEAAGGPRVVFNFAASNVLARQIVNGAPVDVFVSADTAQMDVVDKGGMAAPGTRTPIAGNTLAIIQHRDRTSAIAAPAALAAAEIRRIAVGDPEAVPAGVYAKQYLERVGLWQSLRPKLLPSTSVRAALAAVENGAADAGIVYVTDARAAQDVRVAAIISGPDAPAIVYPACVVQSSKKQEAARVFLTFLQSAEARRLFDHHGFAPPPPGR